MDLRSNKATQNKKFKKKKKKKTMYASQQVNNDRGSDLI